MHFDTLAKDNHMNSEKYSALLSILIKEFDNKFQDCWKNLFFFFCILVTPFSVNINTFRFSDGMYRVLIRCSAQNFYHISLLDFYNTYFTRKKYPVLHNHSLFTSLLFGSTHIWEQLFSKMKYRMCKISSEISEEHLS